MSNNEIVQLKSYDDKTGKEIGNVLPITNSEAVKVKNNKKLTEILTEINDKIERTNTTLDTKASKDDIAKISSGTPLFANSTTEMTDTTKNYVNITDGYVYIYSNSEWEKTNILYQGIGVTTGSVTKDSVSVSTNIIINRNNDEHITSIIETDEHGVNFTTELKRDENGKILSCIQSGGTRTYETILNYNEDRISSVTNKISQ